MIRRYWSKGRKGLARVMFMMVLDKGNRKKKSSSTSGQATKRGGGKGRAIKEKK